MTMLEGLSSPYANGAIIYWRGVDRIGGQTPTGNDPTMVADSLSPTGYALQCQIDQNVMSNIYRTELEWNRAVGGAGTSLYAGGHDLPFSEGLELWVGALIRLLPNDGASYNRRNSSIGIMQLHPYESSTYSGDSPAFFLRCGLTSPGQDVLSLDLQGGVGGSVTNTYAANVICPLSALIGRYRRLVVRMKCSSTGTGSVEAWLDGSDTPVLTRSGLNLGYVDDLFFATFGTYAYEWKDPPNSPPSWPTPSVSTWVWEHRCAGYVLGSTASGMSYDQVKALLPVS